MSASGLLSRRLNPGADAGSVELSDQVLLRQAYRRPPSTLVSVSHDRAPMPALDRWIDGDAVRAPTATGGNPVLHPLVRRPPCPVSC